jgi:hypothetical protein
VRLPIGVLLGLAAARADSCAGESPSGASTISAPLTREMLSYLEPMNRNRQPEVRGQINGGFNERLHSRVQ